MGHHPKKSSGPKLSGKERLNIKRKEEKKFRTEKKARLIVRNLSFKTTEEKFHGHFSQYGDIVEVKLLKRPDGKLVGCGFVQFKEVQNAARARFHVNGKEFLGRKVDCDWALAKNKFLEKRDGPQNSQVEIKEEPIDLDELNDTVATVKSEENEDESIMDVSKKEEDESSEEIKDEEEDKDELDDEDMEDKKVDSDLEEEDDDEIEDKKDIDIKPSMAKYHSNDVTEGKTVFVKNIPFTATNDDLKQCMRQFGPVYYALICFDKFTEHSKGTGFVKFVNVEDAEKCLQAGTELKLEDNILDCVKALNRNDISNKKTDKDEKKDSRNLYLVKEGVVLAGTPAAQGVSASDMAKRLQIEQYKTQMLRNLNMFVSRNRLVVHNLPSAWDDSKFRQLMQKHGGEKAFIKEARIMRNMKKLDSKGVGESKEYGFVTFGNHEQALQALRSLNNNPNIFAEGKRPIVAFSIENKSMIKAKEKRMMNSKLKNPKSKDYKPNWQNSQAETTGKPQKWNSKQTNQSQNTTTNKNTNVNQNNNPSDSKSKKRRQRGKKRKLEESNNNEGAKKGKTEENQPTYAGVEAKKGVNKMRSRYNLKTQAQLHHQSLKAAKKKEKSSKKSLAQRKQEFIRQPGQKINKKPEGGDSFSKLVNSYKKKLMSAPSTNKQKWYEGT